MLNTEEVNRLRAGSLPLHELISKSSRNKSGNQSCLIHPWPWRHGSFPSTQSPLHNTSEKHQDGWVWGSVLKLFNEFCFLAVFFPKNGRWKRNKSSPLQNIERNEGLRPSKFQAFMSWTNTTRGTWKSSNFKWLISIYVTEAADSTRESQRLGEHAD